MTQFRVCAAFVLMGLAATSSAFGQAVTEPRVNASVGTGQILQNFLTIQRSALQRELRVLNRCIVNARENLRDIQGNINRVAQTDLLNCSRRLQQLRRAEARLARLAERRAAEAEAAAQLAEVNRQRSSGSQTGQ